MTKILEVIDVSKAYGGVKANEDISLSIDQGSIVGLIGPNGSGKTTLFNSIVGAHPIDKGSIKFNNEELSSLTVDQISRRGLLRTFQQTKIYGQMTCMMNMKISKKLTGKFSDMFQTIPKEVEEEAEQILSFVGLYQKRNLRAGELSFGQQKLLELAMALINGPKMLILDEPTAGINPTLINGIVDRLIKVNQKYNITLFVIEHNMRVIMNLAQKIYCMAYGRILAEGNPEEIKNNKKVIDAYLGAAH